MPIDSQAVVSPGHCCDFKPFSDGLTVQAVRTVFVGCRGESELK